MNKTQAGRMLTLAYFLKTEVAYPNFNQRFYGVRNYGFDSELRCSAIHSCCTSACALGWSTFIWPEKFRLRFTSYEKYARIYVKVNRRWVHYPNWANPRVCDFFGLHYCDCNDIFTIREMTPKEKAAQIEQIVNSYGWEYSR